MAVCGIFLLDAYGMRVIIDTKKSCMEEKVYFWASQQHLFLSLISEHWLNCDKDDGKLQTILSLPQYYLAVCHQLWRRLWLQCNGRWEVWKIHTWGHNWYSSLQLLYKEYLLMFKICIPETTDNTFEDNDPIPCWQAVKWLGVSGVGRDLSLWVALLVEYCGVFTLWLTCTVV